MVTAEDRLLEETIAQAQGQIGLRLGLGAATAACLGLLAGWKVALGGAMVLLAGQLLGHGHGAWLLRTARGSACRAALTSLNPVVHGVVCLAYSGLAPGFWFWGGPPGQVVAVMFAAACAQHVWLHDSAAPRFPVVALAAHLVWLAALPASTALGWTPLPARASGVPDALAYAVPALAGGVFTWHLILSTRRNQRFAAELARARAAAEAAAQAKSRFLASMSHEIRTPMNGVVGMADLLAEAELEPRHREHARVIRASGEALLAIIDDVLVFSKFEADRLSLRPEPTDLRAAAEDVVALLALRVREKGLDLVADLDPALPGRVLADGGRLRQVLTNLAGNAVKFTDAGHVVLRLRAAAGVAAPSGSVAIRVEVEDTGCGVPPDQRGRMFDPSSSPRSRPARIRARGWGWRSPRGSWS